MSLSQASFDAVADLFHNISGIRLTPAKRPLVEGRLQKLAQDKGVRSLDAYVSQLLDEQDLRRLFGWWTS
ncbi:protein-glutamate O-methyltransferase CheR [Ideonella paludis]|uniref:hypothetical protein n=1 Tax=Ideonella paludis TaxID=1233411 RepID=UPI00362B57FF